MSPPPIPFYLFRDTNCYRRTLRSKNELQQQPHHYHLQQQHQEGDSYVSCSKARSAFDPTDDKQVPSHPHHLVSEYVSIILEYKKKYHKTTRNNFSCGCSSCMLLQPLLLLPVAAAAAGAAAGFYYLLGRLHQQQTATK